MINPNFNFEFENDFQSLNYEDWSVVQDLFPALIVRRTIWGIVKSLNFRISDFMSPREKQRILLFSEIIESIACRLQTGHLDLQQASGLVEGAVYKIFLKTPDSRIGERLLFYILLFFDTILNKREKVSFELKAFTLPLKHMTKFSPEHVLMSLRAR